ncbi:MAG TPA: hypothetical protein VIU65_10090 [Pyrinomonadaceae bacterium]
MAVAKEPASQMCLAVMELASQMLLAMLPESAWLDQAPVARRTPTRHKEKQSQ